MSSQVFTPFFMEGFDGFQTENPTHQIFNYQVHEEMRARGLTQFVSPSTSLRVPSFHIPDVDIGKSLEHKQVYSGAFFGDNANIRIGNGNLLESGNAISFRVHPQNFETIAVTLPNSVETELSLCYLFSLQEGFSDTTINATNVYAVETGGLIISSTVQGNNSSQNSASNVSSPSGVFGGFSWASPRHLTVHRTGPVDASGNARMDQGTRLNFFESTSAGILLSEALSTSAPWSVFIMGTAGVGAKRKQLQDNGLPDLNSGDVVFGARLDDIVFWSYNVDPLEPSALYPVSAAPNARVRLLPINTVTTDGTSFGVGTDPERLSSFDGDDTGIAITGTESINITTNDVAIQNEFPFGTVLGIGTVHSRAAPEGSYDYEVELSDGVVGGEHIENETQTDSTFRPVRRVYKERGDETPYTLLTLSDVEIRIEGVGSSS